jgi:hypothetical protein
MFIRIIMTIQDVIIVAVLMVIVFRVNAAIICPVLVAVWMHFLAVMVALVFIVNVCNVCPVAEYFNV